jgi:hypothetical protein
MGVRSHRDGPTRLPCCSRTKGGELPTAKVIKIAQTAGGVRCHKE